MAALLIVLIGTFTLALNIRPVRATIRRVPEDYPTIQKAIDHAKNGDTVLVSAGTYIEDIVISDKSISLIGEDAGNTTIRNKTYDPG